ncbi:protein FANTASTIC FOUR 1-like [Oryza sativa Japonica Group]|uniref:Os05g0390300 protein n=2 Tax=Oryza TaxID=4527 RepID=Q6I5X4_ORYSJ|nr:hypothetical protein [Oryza sativa Japonica Group]BAH93133.1 Os05g0390300 [Oryza sativa Japonica Group]|eukprot:NP_001174405.1 Os05g0390300 [Oryza sativa Japonica Group]
MPSLLDSPPQITPAAAAGDWSSLYAAAQAETAVKAPRHGAVAVKKAAAYGGGGGRRIKNLEMCTEALGCETGGVDGAAATAADAVVVAAAAAAAAAEDAMPVVVETDGAERKRRAREEEAGSMVELAAAAARARRAGPRGGAPLPPPLTTLARGGSRVRMVQERRDGRLAVYAVRTAGVQAERCGGRLRLLLVPCAGCSNAAECHQKEKQLIKQEAEDAAAIVTKKEEEHDAGDEATPEEEYGGVAKYVRGGRCVEAEVAAAAAARRGKKWEPEQAAPFWVATS